MEDMKTSEFPFWDLLTFKACIICNHNIHDAEKLDELMSKADAVENHGQKLFAATENLLMPMVQFGFLFPVVLAAIFSTVCFIISYSPVKSSHDDATPFSFRLQFNEDFS